MESIRLKYLCSSFSTPITQDEIKDDGFFPVYGASGLVGYKNDYACDTAYLGIIKDGAGVGRINPYPPKSSLLGTMAYIIPKDNVDVTWLRYAVMSLDLGKDISSTTIPHIYFKDYGNRFVGFSSLPEQRRIADFLDRRCAEIDGIIAKTQQTIEEYKALKQSVITEAVTHGIRPKRPMKDSGNRWVGEIPADWNAIISRFVLDQIGDVDHYMPESVDVGVPYVMTGDLKKTLSSVDFDSCKKISINDYYSLSRKIKPSIGDIIFARYATIGTVCFVDTETPCTISYSCVIIKPSRDMLFGKFLFYYLQASTFYEDVRQYINSNTQGNVGIEALYKVVLPVPSIEEQAEISDYLDKKSLELEKLIESKQQLLTELEAYKKSVIYEYVTGKKEVNDGLV